MKRFVFKLERALRFALLRENQKKQQIAAALQRIAFLQKYSLQLKSKLATDLAAASFGVHSVQAEAGRLAAVPSVQEKKRVEGLLEDERAALSDRQRELMHLSQRRRSLESLREKMEAGHRQQESRREQKQVDEAIRAVGRRSAEEYKG